MAPYIVIIAGIPASGKTTYARHISSKLHIPFIGKDAIKEKLYDVLRFRDFVVGNKIRVNTTDFTAVKYGEIDAGVTDFIADGEQS